MTISGLNAPAHTFACLRIACAVVATGARLATDLLGSALVGSVSHRLDDDSGFQGFIVSPLLPDQPCLVAPVLSFEFLVPPTLPPPYLYVRALRAGGDTCGGGAILSGRASKPGPPRRWELTHVARGGCRVAIEN